MPPRWLRAALNRYNRKATDENQVTWLIAARAAPGYGFATAMTPHAARAPALPVGCVFRSSAFL